MDIYDGDLQYGFNLVFDYDESGKLISVSEPGFTFFYIRDGLGNIIKLVDEQGNDVVKYSYDSWGKVTINTISSLHPSARFNPFMYKGYIYDVETGLYYCNSRYYNPKWGRFISPDSIEYLDPESINGLNLYAYCGNDPVNNADPTGHAFISALLISIGIGIAVGLAGQLTSDLVTSAINGEWTFSSWEMYLGAGLGGALAGALFAVGAGGFVTGAFAYVR